MVHAPLMLSISSHVRLWWTLRPRLPVGILGCNTASAKALRTIQQNDLPNLDPDRRVLGVIRPTAEVIGKLTRSRHVGVLATEGTIKSDSYNLEIQKLWEDVKVTGVPCPLWVPIIENNEADSPGADYFVKKRIDHIMRLDPEIDTLISLAVRIILFSCRRYWSMCTWGAYRTTRRVCSGESARLFPSPSRYGCTLYEECYSEVLHHRKSRKVQRNGTHLPAWAG